MLIPDALSDQVEPTYFMKVFGINAALVGARAVAHLGGGGPACIYAVNPSQDNAVYLNGNSVIVNAQCGLINDSSSSAALYGNGNSILLNAGSIGVAGNYVSNCGNVNCFSPIPATSMVPASDPLAYLNPPPTGPCNYHSYIITTSANLTAGVYCGELYINASCITINFGPGV